MNINQIKYLAVISMLCDHIAYAFLPSSSTIYMAMRMFGRIAAPSMCFVLAQGFIHTSNRKKYFIRLFVFALISQLPFSYFGFGSYTGPIGNVIFTLACAFAIMAVIENINKIGRVPAIVAIVLLLFLSMLSDWLVFAPMFTLSIYLNKDSKDRQALGYLIVSLISFAAGTYFAIKNGQIWQYQFWQLGTVLVIPIIYAYNGKPGSKAAFNKWFFYIFYPAHLMILGILCCTNCICI